MMIDVVGKLKDFSKQRSKAATAAKAAKGPQRLSKTFAFEAVFVHFTRKKPSLALRLHIPSLHTVVRLQKLVIPVE
jgi:hypothetical protein